VQVQSQQFLKGSRAPDPENSSAELDLTAHQAILQRLPGLSLGHDTDNLDIVELSLCVAGARPGTVVTQASYDIESDGCDVMGQKKTSVNIENFSLDFTLCLMVFVARKLRPI